MNKLKNEYVKGCYFLLWKLTNNDDKNGIKNSTNAKVSG